MLFAVLLFSPVRAFQKKKLVGENSEAFVGPIYTNSGIRILGRKKYTDQCRSRVVGRTHFIPSANPSPCPVPPPFPPPPQRSISTFGPPFYLQKEAKITDPRESGIWVTLPPPPPPPVHPPPLAFAKKGGRKIRRNNNKVAVGCLVQHNERGSLNSPGSVSGHIIKAEGRVGECKHSLTSIDEVFPIPRQFFRVF